MATLYENYDFNNSKYEKNKNLDLEKNDVFSLGLTFLEVGTLLPIKGANKDPNKLNEVIL